MILGLTGGIGSGKSAATHFFEALGITVVDADVAARIVVAAGRPELEAISRHFGAGILREDATLDRTKLRTIIFEDPSQKLWLEQLLHPAIRRELVKQLKQSHSVYTILSSPLLFETNQTEFCDKVCLIDVSRKIQIERTMRRDNNSQAQVEAIIAAQWSRDKKLRHADFVLDNSASLADLASHIETLHHTLLDLVNDQYKN